MSAEKGHHNYVFFLQLSSQLPEYFIHISAELNRHSIQLVPVTWKDISELVGRDKRVVITMVPDLLCQRNFNRLRSRHLDFWLSRRHIHLIHVSSFQRINDLFVTKDPKIYSHLQLPSTISEITEKVLEGIVKSTEQNNVWPGGRRAKLPSQSL